MSRTRFVPVLFGVAVLVAVLVLQLGAASSRADNPVINAWVHEDSEIGMSMADGTPVGSQAKIPPTIPAGTYTIHVVDDADIHNFDLTGPGVSQSTDIDGFSTPTWTVTFQPGSTYRFLCDAHPDYMWGSFQTSGAATAGSGGSTGSSGGTSSGSTGSSSSGSRSSSGSGSTATGGTAATALLGTLAAHVSVTGKATLSFEGRAVTRLAHGRYKVTTAQKIFLQQVGHPSTAIARSETVTLKAGHWNVYAAAGKPKTALVVT